MLNGREQNPISIAGVVCLLSPQWSLTPARLTDLCIVTPIRFYTVTSEFARTRFYRSTSFELSWRQNTVVGH